MKYDWILFDADNTIYDFQASSEIAFHLSFEDYDIATGDEEYELFRNINFETWKAFEDNEIDHEQIKQIRFKKLFDQLNVKNIDPLKFNGLYFKKIVENPKYMEGAEQLLNNIIGNVQLGLITNGMKEVQRPRLIHSRKLDVFDLVVISGEIGLSKPNKDFFQYAFDRMDGADKEKVLVVGDSLVADVQGAQAYGLEAVWYNPFKVDDKNGIQPDYEINSLEELHDIIS